MRTIHSILFMVFIFACSRSVRENSAASKFPGVDLSMVPGTVVNHLSRSAEHYLGSPCIVIMPNGDYLISHDVNSWDKDVPLYDKTIILKSTNKGETWEKISELQTQHWASLFYHRDALYIIGTYAKDHNVHIQKSLDGGYSWTSAQKPDAGVLAEGEYHCAPTPVVVHNGRIWRAFEVRKPGMNRQSVMFSAPQDSDLLKRSSWTLSNTLEFDNSWLRYANGWIEGNAVVSPDGELVNMIRIQASSEGDEDAGCPLHSTAAMIHISENGEKATFDPRKDFVKMPGACGKKFTIRYDQISKKYWSLTNWIQPDDLKYLEITNAGRIRNTMALISSKDLRNWDVNSIIYHISFEIDPTTNRAKQGIQYADWQIEGDDMVAVFRTGFEDGLGGPRTYHDANFITFERIKNFRDRTMGDKPLNGE